MKTYNVRFSAVCAVRIHFAKAKIHLILNFKHYLCKKVINI